MIVQLFLLIIVVNHQISRIMLLEFAVQNFKSFKDLQVFSLEASKEKEMDPAIQRVTEMKGGYRVVKVKAVYGANGSGKSNLIGGLVAMWKILKHNLTHIDEIFEFPDSFRLDSNLLGKPSYFQIIFITKGIRYRYGFEIDQQRIHREWLYQKREKEVVLFEREGINLRVNETSFKEGKIIQKGIKLFNEKTLVVSILDQFNFPISTSIKKYITSMRITRSIESTFVLHQTIDFFELNNDFKNWTIKFLQSIDKTIHDIIIKKNIKVNYVEKIPMIIRKSNNNNINIQFNLLEEEAAGTKKMFDFSRMIHFGVKHGKTIIIDELDALLHPKLIRKVIGLFLSPDAHPNAQLIFVMHDTSLMDNDLLRRDQITFVEKSIEGYSEIFDLSDIKGVRATDLFEKNYLKGNYGALPVLNKLENVLLNG